MPSEITELKLTGERTLPGIASENYWFTRHVVAYRFAREIVGDKSVIDVGCGEGYGPAILSARASWVTGVDVAPEVVEHARANYQRENLCFERVEAGSLPHPDNSFDAAVSFQVIEHLADEELFLAEIARVLKPGGQAILSTPNRLTISEGSDTPVNPFHVREYDPAEFEELVSRHFAKVETLGLFHAGWLKLNEMLKIVDFIGFYSMSRFNPRFWSHRFLTPRITPGHFEVRDGPLEGCLDIVAVGMKPADGGGRKP